MSLLENKIAVGTVSAVLPGAKILIYALAPHVGQNRVADQASDASVSPLGWDRGESGRNFMSGKQIT
jgi:hypothetical protein